MHNQLHLRKGDIFTQQMKEISKLATDETYSHRVICMDFQKNIPLPLTGVWQEYYKRQLWVHNFCIHDIVQDKATICFSTQSIMLQRIQMKSYLAWMIAFPTSILLSYLNYVCNTNILTSVYVYYPIRMPCDHDFGRIEQKKRGIKVDARVMTIKYPNFITRTPK